MGIFDRFPYSSTHEMNLDFMLGKATEIAEDMQTVATGMAQVQDGLSAISEKTEQATQAAAAAAQSASSIEGSVTAAEEAAEEAQMHNESAQTWANNALTYKADCQRAATEAAASSSSAAQAATAAAASEDTVAQYAQAANASAQSAANNNDSAHQYANQASASASNATFHSSNAQTAATNAQTAATNANTSATNASASADRAATLKTDVETLHRMCTTAVDLAAEQAVAAGNSAGQAAATKTEVENLVESLPEDFTDLNNTVNQLSDEIDNMKLEKSITFESGLYAGPIPAVGDTYNKTITDNNAWACIKLSVSKYDRIVLYGAASSNTPLWVFTDNDGIVVNVVNGAPTYTTNPFVFDAPSDGIFYASSVASYNHSATHYITNGFADISQIINNRAPKKTVYPLEFTYDVMGIPVQDNFTITSRDPQDIYDLYDGLMQANPDYITKINCADADTELGITRPEYLADFPIYLYKFTPHIINTSAAIKRKIKLMILTGVHSNEKWNVYNVYRILKYICENWKTDKNAATIRTLVELWVIPMVNPWGWANTGIVENAGRVNGNGVNLNRNAPASNWRLTTTGPDYSGPTAGSEYETKIWLYYHDLFNPDVFIDQHTPGMPDTGIFGVLETDITQEYLANVGDVICREISNHLHIVDENVSASTDVVLFDMYSDTNYGQVTLCAREHGTAYSFLFEFSDSSKWSNGTLQTNTVTQASSGIQIREQMQNIYGAWQRLLYSASHDIMH